MPNANVRENGGEEATLFALAWDVLGYEKLVKENREFQMKVEEFKELRDHTISSKLHRLSNEIASYSKGE